MSGINKAILIGNLGAKPELKYLPSGQAVCEMRLATNESWTDRNNQKQERCEWHRIVVWGKMGESCAQYLDKGRQVYVEGRIQTRSWDAKDSGEKRYMTEIIASTVQFLGGKPSSNEGRRDSGPPSGGDNSRGEGDFGGSPPSDDGIPF
jgi:single-strand DNA-binding protein